MAKLSQTFKIEGGSNTAPVSNNQPQKLSQAFKIESGNSAPVSSGSGKLSQTFTVGQNSVLPELKKSTPTPTIPEYNKEVIDLYESIPDANIFQRLFNKKARNNYNTKQMLNPFYEQNKDLQTKQLLSNLGIPDNDIMRQSGNTRAEEKRITSLLSSKGITDKKTIDAVKGYSERLLNQKADTNLTEYADEHPVKGTLLSGLTKVASDIPGTLQNTVDYLSGNPLSSSRGANAMTRTTQNMRNAVSDDMSGLGKFAYNVGTSIMDMAPILALGGNAGLGYAGASAMQGSIPDLIDRGLTPNQIMLTSLANGTAEAMLEKLPLGNLEKWANQPIEKTFKSIAKVIGSQMLSEGIEETGTDLANTIFDALINGNKAELSRNIQKNGFWPAMWDYIKQVGYDGLAGAVSGGVMGGGNVGVNMVRNGLANIPTLEQTNNATTPVEQPTSASNAPVEAQQTNTPTKSETPRERQQRLTKEAADKFNALSKEQQSELRDFLKKYAPLEEARLHESFGSEYGDSPDGDRKITEISKPLADKYPDFFNTATYSDGTVKIRPYKTFIDAIEQSNKQDVAVQAPTEQALNNAVEAEAAQNQPDKVTIQDTNTPAQISQVITQTADTNAEKTQHYKSENSRVNDFLNSRNSGSIQMENGQIIEHYSIKDMRSIVNEIKSNAIVPEDNSIAIRYNDGNVKVYSEGDDANNINLNNVSGIIWDNGSTTAYAGKGIKIENYDELNDDWGGDDWRVDFTTKKDVAPPLENTDKKHERDIYMLEDVGLRKGAREIPSLNESTANETEVPLSEIPDPRNGATYTSKTAYTLRNSDVFNQSKKARALIEQQIKDGVFNVDRQTWLAAGTEAVEEIDEKGIDAVKEDILKKKTETTQTQIAESVYVVDNEIQKAIESGDASELARFTNGFNQRIHKVGQALQAMRMYGNTAAGMVLTTDTISNEETKKALQSKKGKERAKQNAKLAEAFKRMGYDGSMEKEKVDKTYNQILSEVKATIAREYASQDERFSDTDAEFLARMIFNGATTNEILDALNRHYATGFFGMSSEDLEAINDLYKRADRASSSKEKAKLKADAAVIASKYAGNTSFMDKMNAWRYLAMLGNPRTMIRNILGNTIFGGVTDIKDAVGAVIESAVIKDGEKTKALINPKTDAELLKATRNDFDKTAYEEATQGGHKYDMKNDIRDSRRVFKTQLIEKWRTGTNRVLEESDIKALKSKYAKALAGYLKANGYDASVLKTDNDILDRARAYAIEQAKIATFHSDNVIADILNDWSRATSDRGAVGKTIGAVLEAVMPFKKTPANILTQGVEYSPLGLLKLASQIHNQAGATAYIDTISKTLTGSGILLLGIALKSAGVLIGQKDDKEDPYGKGSNYALKIGDHTYTIDWMAPAALPLFAGAALYDVFNPNGEKGDVTLLDAISSIGEPVVEMSMLQGFNEMLTSFNSDKNKGAAFVANELTGYASQYIPTLAGQIARTIDPYRRSTRTNSSSYKHPFAAAFEKAGEKALNKIPGLSMTNQKYVDIWGNEQKNTGGNILGRAVQNFVSPGYWNDVSMTDREKKLADLQKSYDGSGSLIPSLASSNKPDGSRMTNAEYEKWAKARGQELGKAVDAALKYKGSGTKTEDLQEYIHDIENFANAVAMNKQFKKPIAKTYEKAYEAYKLNGYAGVMEYYKMLNGADLDGNGSVTQEELAKYLRSSDIPRKQREDYFKIKFPKAKEIPTLR